MIRHSIQIPWRIAQATRIAILPTIFVLKWIGDFWTTWADVYEPRWRSAAAEGEK